MIGKRQGNHPAPREPARDPAKDDSIGQLGLRRRSCKDDGLVPVGQPQRLQPARRVKYRGACLRLDQIRPARILERINRVNSQPKPQGLIALHRTRILSARR